MILVTGAGGFIGKEVCRVLSELGYEVVALDRQFATSTPYRQVMGDVGDPAFLARVFESQKFETVVHLASILKTASQEALRVSVGGSLHLLELAAQSGVSKFIYGSSITAYGPKPLARYGEVSEEEPPAPNTIYGVSKRYVELAGQNYNDQGLLQFVSLRIGMVVGPGAVNTSTPWRSQIFEQLGLKQPAPINFSFGENARLPLVYLTEVAEIIRHLHEAKRPKFTLYNTPVENWTARELAGYIQTLNPGLRTTFSSTAGLDDPEAIDSRRFRGEFGYQPIPLRERFQEFAGKN